MFTTTSWFYIKIGGLLRESNRLDVKIVYHMFHSSSSYCFFTNFQIKFYTRTFLIIIKKYMIPSVIPSNNIIISFWKDTPYQCSTIFVKPKFRIYLIFKFSQRSRKNTIFIFKQLVKKIDIIFYKHNSKDHKKSKVL